MEQAGMWILPEELINKRVTDMKKLLFVILTLISGLSFGQHLNGTDIRLLNGSSSTTGTSNGTIYYDATLGLFQFRQGGVWAAPGNYLPTNIQTANYTLALSDVGKIVQMNLSSAGNVTVPPNSSIALPLNTWIYIQWLSGAAGQPSLVAGAGVTINSSSGGLTIPIVNTIVALRQESTDVWTLENGAGFSSQTANFVLAGPTSGGAAIPTFRALVSADLP